MTQHNFQAALSALEVFADDTNSLSARGDLGFHLTTIRAALQAAIAQPVTAPVQNETGRDGLYAWKCNCCTTKFSCDQKNRTDDGSRNGGARCPCCKADGQYTYRDYSSPVDDLKSVLCDPEGKACISGSDGDRKIIDKSLAALQQPAQGWQPIETCPSDGSPVWIYMPKSFQPIQDRLADGEHWRMFNNETSYKITHWMPRLTPAAPDVGEVG